MASAPGGARLPGLLISGELCWHSVGLLTMLLVAFAGPAVAQSPAGAATSAPDQPRKANWLVTPSLKLTETYTDNVFLSPLKQKDWITQVVPGISLTANGP